jgi:hypothetical protein
VSSEEELRRIRGDIALQYPEFIDYLKAEGIDISSNTTRYLSLVDALKKYKEAGIKEAPQHAEGYFATVAKELETTGDQIDAVREKYAKLRRPEVTVDPTGMTTGTELPKTAEELKKINRDETIELNKLQIQRDTFVRESTEQISKYIKTGVKPEELHNTLKKMFIDEKDMAMMEERFQLIVNLNKDMQGKVKKDVELTAEESKKRTEAITAEYEAMYQKIQDRYDIYKDHIEGSDFDEGEKRSTLIDLERERAVESVKILRRESDLKIQIITHTAMTHRERIQQVHEVETKLAKDRRKIQAEMYAYAKEQSDKAQADLVESQEWQTKGLMDQLKWKEEWFKLEEDQTEESIERTIGFYKERTSEIIANEERTTRSRIDLLKEAHLSEKDFNEQAKDIAKDSAESQIEAYEELHDTLMDTYKDLLGKLKEIEKKSKDIKKNGDAAVKAWGDTQRDITGQGGDKQSFSDIKDELGTLESQIRKAIAGGTEEGLDDAESLLGGARSLFGKVDYEAAIARSSKTSVDSDLNSIRETFEALQQAIVSSRQATAKAAEEAIKNQLPDVKSQAEVYEAKIKEISDMVENGQFKLKLQIDKDDFKRQVEEADVYLKPKIDPEMKDRMAELMSGVDAGGGIPVKPVIDQPALDGMRATLATPTENPHTVNANTEAAAAAIEALKAATYSYHYIQPITLPAVPAGEGGGGESAEGYATGGYLGGGWGGGDQLHILAELGEFINRKEAVRYYGRDFFSALNSMAIPKSLLAQLASRDTPRFRDGGSVELPSGSGDPQSSGAFTLRLQLGDEEFPVQVNQASRNVFDEFMSRYDKERLKRRRK